MNRIVKVVSSMLAILIVAAGSFYAWAHLKTSAALEHRFDLSVQGMDQLVAAADRALGERIVRVRNGCVDCHGADLAGRVFLEDPAMGTYAGANLTPYALKSWTNDEIGRAIHLGIGRGGQALRFMPAFEFHALSKEDVAAVVAYLRTVPPVERPSLPVKIGPLARILFATGQLPALLSTFFLDTSKGFREKPAEAATADFGEYLAVSGCIGCHGQDFAGGPIPGAPPEWIAAADIRLGRTGWTQEVFLKAMQTGITPTTGEKMRFPMPTDLLMNMNETELRALYAYLVTLK